MDKDTKERLDNLVLGLQRSLVEAVDNHDEAKTDFYNGYYHGRMDVYHGMISQINARFNTNYESHSLPLQEYFAKPCIRDKQPSVANEPETLRGN